MPRTGVVSDEVGRLSVTITWKTLSVSNIVTPTHIYPSEMVMREDSLESRAFVVILKSNSCAANKTRLRKV